jgi:hypothetical protein
MEEEVRKNWESYENAIICSTLEEVFHAITKCSINNKEQNLWRGIANSEWGILSSIQRYIINRPGLSLDHKSEFDVRALETALIYEFENWQKDSQIYSSTIAAKLALMQHYGAPTRLIDVSANPYVALWFACADHEKANDGVLINFSCESIDRITTNKMQRILTLGMWDDNLRPDIQWFKILKRTEDSGSLCILEPYISDSRLHNQQGMFVFGYVQNSVSTLTSAFPYHSDLLTPIIIKESLKPALRAALKMSFGIEERYLFPDSAGYSAYINNSSISEDDQVVIDELSAGIERFQIETQQTIENQKQKLSRMSKFELFSLFTEDLGITLEAISKYAPELLNQEQ